MITSGVPREVADLAAEGFVRSAPPDWAAHARPPFQVRRVTLRPGEVTAAHNHHDLEVWVVLDGEGEVGWDGLTRPLRAGDSVYLPPLAPHTLRNIATDRPLSFFSIWWEDMAGFQQAHAERQRAGATRADGRPVLLLPSFPTPNGELHLGHIAGPFLTADTCRRALLAAGEQAKLLLGTVGHQSQVAAAAAAEGLSFYELAERNTDAIQEGLRAARVEWDVFVRPSDQTYPGLAREVFERLLADGAVVARTEPTNHCAPCGRFLLEAFVAGRCPHCGSDQTAGIECEVCALPYHDRDLVDPSCATCGAPAEQVPLTRYFLPLEPLRERLTGYLRGAAMHSRLRGYVERVIAHPLPDLPVSTPADSGIPIRVEQVDGADPAHAEQRMYSAFELVARFLVALEHLARQEGVDGWAAYAAATSPRTALFFGFDNAFLRAFAFPAVLGAFTDLVALPDTLVCNEFYLLDGQKFSTGRKHAVWAREALTEDTADQLRLYLTATAPDVRRRDFTAEGYARFSTGELGRWQSWLDGVGSRVAEHFAGVAPEGGAWNAEAERFYGHIARLCATAALELRPERAGARAVLAGLRELVARAEDFAEVSADVQEAMPGTGLARTCAALELMAVRAVAMAAAPLAPGLGARLATAVGEPDGVPLSAVPGWVAPGAAVKFETRYFTAPR
ncbi:class I tRNA ligase family protein [Actinokineospora bangkokensis]|uniref:Methionine--tRNA ligase n=1 Tax=Actinokineospora bangkokensis TaxID=1193682 RepID=A0A1Q9LJL9_9PSEU|nr:class I tRNA ligase family protein [Actinokineospora bangkokensis]OLR92241.1 methionine--tRNA ligase [Actinokineospora bangkokensis]